MDQTKITPLNAPLAPAPLTAPLAPAPLASLTEPASHTPTTTTPLGTIDTPIAPQKSTALVPKAEQSLAARVLGNGRSGSRYYGDGHSTKRLPGDGRSRALGTSDETDLSKNIIATHESDERGLPVKPVIHTIEVIFHRANVELPGFNQASLGYSETSEHEKALYSYASLQDIIELPPRITSAISCEILSKCSTGVDVHTITMNILHLIKQYNWDSKAVLALSSFAITFGEFRQVVSLYSNNELAKSVAILKQMPEYLEHAVELRPKLDALFDVIKEIIDVTKKIVEFYDLPRHEYFTTESPELLAAVNHIPTAVYWTIRSIVVSATQILALTGMGIEYLTETWELSSLAHKLNNIKGHLVEIIDRCVRFIARKKDEEEFVEFDRILGGTHIDNQKPLKALFNPKDGQPALYDCYSKRRVSIDELRRKVVVLFITDLDPELMRGQDFQVLQQLYTEKKANPTKTESQYEILWVPVVDYWTEDKHRVVFERRRNQMEWYSIYHPTVVPPVAIRYIKQRWNFIKKPMVVVMDVQGRIVHRNTIHMICIWGGQSYPFTTNREKLLWEQMSWTIDLVADSFDPNLPTWIQEGRHVCLYGGEDIDWIRKFTRVAKDVAREANIALELLYVGKSKPEKIVRNIIDTINKEGLSRTLDLNYIWYFWVRMESMWHSKGQLTNSENVKNDPIMQGIIAMLSYGSSEQGWAVISRGFGEMVKGNGEHMFKGLNEHGRWVNREKQIGFLPALDEYLKQVHLDAPHHCTKLILPATGAMPESVSCSECGHLMEKYTMFRCCSE
ncbi:hypothetical protein UlMin_040137 [Ulmus minor]